MHLQCSWPNNQIFVDATYPYIEEVITYTIMSKCGVCLKRDVTHSYIMTCGICSSNVHVKCLPCVKYNLSLTNRHDNAFYCSLCLRDIFDFNHLEYDEFIEAISQPWEKQPLVSLDTSDNQGLIFSPFDLNDKFDNPRHVNPEIQFYNSHYTVSLQFHDYDPQEMLNGKMKQTPNISISLFITYKYS